MDLEGMMLDENKPNIGRQILHDLSVNGIKQSNTQETELNGSCQGIAVLRNERQKLQSFINISSGDPLYNSV